MKNQAYYHLRDYLSFTNCIEYFCHCIGNTESIFMIGVRSVPYTVPRQTVSGVAVALPLEILRQRKVLDLMQEYKISARLTFSNSLLREEHLQDRKCNTLCSLLEERMNLKMV